MRAEGCGGVPAVGAAARRDSALDAAARELARDAKLADALARVGYPAASSTSFHIRGSRDDGVIREMLAERYCAPINDPKLVELGVSPKRCRDMDRHGAAARRCRSRRCRIRPPSRSACSSSSMPRAREARQLRPRALRGRAAADDVDDVDGRGVGALARHGAARRARLTTGSDGSASGERMTRAGYAWQRLGGEHRGRASPTRKAPSQAWLDSPGHCATLMEPRFTETGIAFALAPGKNPAVYWTQVFATPR